MLTVSGARAANIQGKIRVMVSFTMAVSGFRMYSNWTNAHDINAPALSYTPLDFSVVSKDPGPYCVVLFLIEGDF